MIARERVRSRVVRSAQFPLTVIVAPAGYGKSTAVEEYLSGLDGPRIFYRVDESDEVLGRFILGLARDSGPAFPPQVALAVLHAHENQPGDRSTEELASVCAVHFRRHGGVVAIDNFHHAQNQETVRFLQALIEQTKDRVRWIVASRSRAWLPLGAWIATGLCDIPIDESLLAFTDEDLGNAAREGKIALSYAETSAIVSATSGLPISVGLALRYAEAGYDIAQITAQTRLASYEYLTSHMYSKLGSDEQEYLCFGALLPTIRVDVFEEAGFADASAVLNDLYQHSSFLSRRLGSAGTVATEYVCHDLFRDYLRDRLAARGSKHAQSVQRRAAEALNSLGMPAAALPLYVAAGAFTELGQCLAKHGYPLIDAGYRDIVESAINALPADDVRWKSVSLQLRAELAASTEDYKVVEGLFTAAIDCAATGEDRIKATFRFAQHQHLHDPLRAEQTLETIVSSGDCPSSLRAHAFSYLLATRSWNDPYYDLREPLREFEGMLGLIESDLERVDALLFACCAATFCGDHRAERLGQAALEIARSRNMVSALLPLYGTLARDALYRGEDPAVVLRYVSLHEAVALQIEGEPGRRASILLKLGLAMRMADAAGIEDLLRTYEAFKASPTSGQRSVILRAHALLRAWRGEFDPAYDLLTRAWPGVYGTYRPVARALCAVFAAGAGRRDDVRALLLEGRAWLSGVKPWNDVLLRNTDVARQLYAIAAAMSGKHRDALQLVRFDASPTGTFAGALSSVVRAIIEGPAIALAEERALHEQLCALGYPDVAAILQIALQRYRSEDSAGAVTLTAQEAAVLEALASGLAPKQIAEMMDRQVSTIQGHIRGVVSKLGCSGREQAIRIARSRGLLKR